MRALLLAVLLPAALGVGHGPQGDPPAAADPGNEQLTADREDGAWQYRLLGANGAPLPVSSDDEILELLRTAEVISAEETDRGITRPLKLLLEQDGIRFHAVLRRVNTSRPTRAGPPGRNADLMPGCKLSLDTRDCYRYEVAAYELSRLLGLDRVPPVVLRKYGGKEGSLQLWLEQTITESERRARQLEPPDLQRWRDQWQQQNLFDSLIANRDRNLGNTLIDPSWTLWYIDHTRAFTITPQPLYLDRVLRCERGLWQALRDRDSREVRERLAPYLTPFELAALLQRWDKLVQHLEEQIEQRGEETVLFDLPPHRHSPAPWWPSVPVQGDE